MGFKRDRPLSMENGHESKIMVNMEGPVASPSCVEKESLLNHVPCKLQSTLTAYFETNNHKGLREQTTTKFLHNKANSSLVKNKCVACLKEESSKLCSDCERALCKECCRSCSLCQKTFCSTCSCLNYEPRQVTATCLSCL
ncbi:uncharacterized protein LOC135120603 isoform X2 [Zophobas morio]|uniref:uncharacterized protein LOC135120603 isoform X2 n=1 Tax=Zophobas morio TaxID=2755281 RepID=UPI0030836021